MTTAATPARTTAPTTGGSADARWWIHEPGVTFLNHGSFGGCPAAVLETQAAWRARLEAEPVRFFGEDLFGLLDWVRGDVAGFLGCDPGGLVFVPNATTGVATVLANLDLRAGDEILLTDHEYPACANNLRHVAAQSGATPVAATLPFPDPTPDAIVEAVLGRVTERTRAALISHITSASAMVLPVERLVPELERRGVRTIVDGAHVPGHLPLDLDALAPSYYTGNLHKWVCSPKGSAVLGVREDHRDNFRPMVLSNMAEQPPADRPRLHTEFDYVGTQDPTAVLTVPAALRIMAAIARSEPPRRSPAAELPPDGVLDEAWSTIRERNRALAVEGRRIVCDALEAAPPVPDEMTACIALIALPPHDDDARARLEARPTRYHDALQDALLARHRIQVPVHSIPGPGGRVRCVRISAQLFNTREQYAALAEALREELRRERGGG
ncbi:MAG: aminotransferase class V-fold PLP-dependent enzyme [Planctomycetota bacterium]